MDYHSINDDMQTEESDSYPHLCKFLILVLSLFTLVNILFFFFIKNTTHELSIQSLKINNEIVNETRQYSIIKANFSKKYNVKTLKEMVKNKLQLKSSNVKQIEDITSIITKQK